MASEAEIRRAMEHGISFSGARPSHEGEGRGVKTKARKKAYRTGAHHSEATQKKAVKSQKRFQRIRSGQAGKARKD